MKNQKRAKKSKIKKTVKSKKSKPSKTKKARAGKKSSATTYNKPTPVAKPYPLFDEGKTVYVQHPVMKNNGKWVGADVLKDGGYISVENNPLKTEFDTHDECQKACNIHNSYHGWTKEEAVAIISESMDCGDIRKTKLALEYVETGAKDKKFWNSSKGDWNDFKGSVEQYEMKKAEGKMNTDKDLALLCLNEAELWFEGFDDDSIQNRRDFTASLYRHIVNLKEKNVVYQEEQN